MCVAFVELQVALGTLCFSVWASLPECFLVLFAFINLIMAIEMYFWCCNTSLLFSRFSCIFDLSY
jgi:hypothetical protein